MTSSSTVVPNVPTTNGHHHAAADGKKVAPQESKAAAVPPPPVLWAQRPGGHLLLTICLADTKDPVINLTTSQLHFKGNGGPEQRPYEVTLDFYDELQAELKDCRYVVRDRCIEFRLVRSGGPDAAYWPRLLKDAKKQHWLKVDFEKWLDEDEVGGGMDDMDSFGGGAGGGGNLEEMMRSMGGLGGAGGLGGPPGGRPDLDDLDLGDDDDDDDDVVDSDDEAAAAEDDAKKKVDGGGDKKSAVADDDDLPELTD